MLLGVISDTHGYLPDTIHDAFRGVDKIVHAGDVGSYSVILELQSIAPVTGVLGNNDYDGFGGILTPLLSFTAGGVDFKVAHFQRKVGWPGEPGTVRICGHTHVPRLERENGSYLLNPGSTTYPRAGSNPSAAVVEVDGGKVLDIRFCDLTAGDGQDHNPRDWSVY